MCQVGVLICGEAHIDGLHHLRETEPLSFNLKTEHKALMKALYSHCCFPSLCALRQTLHLFKFLCQPILDLLLHPPLVCSFLHPTSAFGSIFDSYKHYN